jgi:phosphomannomutase
MNELVVLQTSQGLCEYISSTKGGSYDFAVVIGYDGRHNSRVFAHRTAAPFLRRGCRVYLFSDLVPTPYVAFAVKHLGCAAGIMVTASHNPKADNGYKVYWDGGAQIVPPHDGGIASAILDNLEPWSSEQAWDAEFVTGHSNVTDPLDDVHKACVQ